MESRSLVIDYLRISLAEFRIMLFGFYEGFIKYSLLPAFIILVFSLWFDGVHNLIEHYLVSFLSVQDLYSAYTVFAILVAVSEIFYAKRIASFCFRILGNYWGIVFVVMSFGAINGWCAWREIGYVFMIVLCVTALISLIHPVIYNTPSMDLRKRTFLNILIGVIVFVSVYVVVFYPAVVEYMEFKKHMLSILLIIAFFILYKLNAKVSSSPVR